MTMPVTLHTVPCLSDNYAFIVHDEKTGATAVIDVPEEAPIMAALNERGWKLTDILITHHHNDHIGGVDGLRKKTGAAVWGAEADAHRLPKLDKFVKPGQPVGFAGQTVEVLDVPGHTVGHIAYHFPDSNLVFTGDSLMALGCGRLFEGTPDQMWASLSKLMALPDETTVCSGHEYTQSNARFALNVDPDNAALQQRSNEIDTARSQGMATVPSNLGVEKATNPFLRAADPAIRAGLGMESASDTEVFAEIRRRKDSF